MALPFIIFAAQKNYKSDKKWQEIITQMEKNPAKKNNKNLGKIVRNSEIARENYVFHN